jgi:hypothetical protein
LVGTLADNSALWAQVCMGRDQTRLCRVRASSREGIFKGNRRFPLERRFFWYFSFAGERKVHKRKQTDKPQFEER